MERILNMIERNDNNDGSRIPCGSTYDSKGNRLTYKDSNGYWYEYTYDSKGNLLTFKDSNGYWYEYTYDSNGNLLTFKNSDEKDIKYDNFQKVYFDTQEIAWANDLSINSVSKAILDHLHSQGYVDSSSSRPVFKYIFIGSDGKIRSSKTNPTEFTKLNIDLETKVTVKNITKSCKTVTIGNKTYLEDDLVKALELIKEV
jgi:YD repeat-containing protein